MSQPKNCHLIASSSHSCVHPFTSLTDARPSVSLTPVTPGLLFPKAVSGAISAPRLEELPRPSDLALFFHTSGTTGKPKVCAHKLPHYIEVPHCHILRCTKWMVMLDHKLIKLSASCPLICRSGSPLDPREHRSIPVQHRGDLRARPLGSLLPRHAVVPRAWPHGRSALAPIRRFRRDSAKGGEILGIGVLEGLLRLRRNLLHRSADDASGGARNTCLEFEEDMWFLSSVMKLSENWTHRMAVHQALTPSPSYFLICFA